VRPEIQATVQRNVTEQDADARGARTFQIGLPSSTVSYGAI
jgi:hypothetical protein